MSSSIPLTGPFQWLTAIHLQGGQVTVNAAIEVSQSTFSTAPPDLGSITITPIGSASLVSLKQRTTDVHNPGQFISIANAPISVDVPVLLPAPNQLIVRSGSSALINAFISASSYNVSEFPLPIPPDFFTIVLTTPAAPSLESNFGLIASSRFEQHDWPTLFGHITGWSTPQQVFNHSTNLLVTAVLRAGFGAAADFALITYKPAIINPALLISQSFNFDARFVDNTGANQFFVEDNTSAIGAATVIRSQRRTYGDKKVNMLWPQRGSSDDSYNVRQFIQDGSVQPIPASWNNVRFGTPPPGSS